MKLKVISVSLLLLTGLCHAESSIESRTCFSEGMLESRNVRVYLPEGYDAGDTDTHYPVVYFLHGGYVNNASYPMFTDALDELIWSEVGSPPAGYIHPCIAVMPNGNGDYYGGLTWWADSELNGPIASFVAEELVAWVDAEYHTIAERDARALIGHSMGGCGAASIGMLWPGVFGTVCTFGGVVDLEIALNGITELALQENGGNGPYNPVIGTWSQILYSTSAAFSPNLQSLPYQVDLPVDDSGQVIQTVFDRWREHDPVSLAASVTQPPVFYLQCGDADSIWIDCNRSLFQTMEQNGLAVRLDEISGGGHNDILTARFPYALRFADSLYAESVDVSRRDTPLQPARLELSAPFPNPCNPSTTVWITPAREGRLTIEVIDLLGRVTQRLSQHGLQGQSQPLSIEFSGSSGLRFLRVSDEAGNVALRRVLLLQ